MYLKIENPGVAPLEAYTLLGASTKRLDAHQIGQFGSGNKHGVSTLLRHNLPPTVFSGSLRMEFETKPHTVHDGIKENTFKKVFVKYSGTYNNKTKNSTEELGFVLDYGSNDWTSTDLALREFISNAIDRVVAQYLHENPDATSIPHEVYQKVVVELVNDNQVRAKKDFTRVFVPVNADILNFFANIHKWFLHFKEPHLLNAQILPKMNRNLTPNSQVAVIYRKGVRVREIESTQTPSLFDYNLNNLEMDESRKVDDWKVASAAAKVLKNADVPTLTVLWQSMLSRKVTWEHDFSSYSLDCGYDESAESIQERSHKWNAALKAVAGDNAVLAQPDSSERVLAKGFTVVEAPASYVNAATKLKVPTPELVLSQDCREGRTILDPSPALNMVFNQVWNSLINLNMTYGKQPPKLFSFSQLPSDNGGQQLLGFYRDNAVYVNQTIDGSSQQLFMVVLEEITHYLTGAVDFSRDFQNFLVTLATKLLTK